MHPENALTMVDYIQALKTEVNQPLQSGFLRHY
jgi:hypothetical protein